MVQQRVVVGDIRFVYRVFDEPGVVREQRRGSVHDPVRGQVVMVNGRKDVTVILDGVGCFKCRLPLEDIVKAIK